MQICRTFWIDGWEIIVPNSDFDSLLSNIIMIDSFSLYLGLDVLEKVT